MTTPPSPPSSLELPRFCGVPTFMRLPQAADARGLDVAVIGLPSDSGSPFRTGARFGPQAVRAMSVMLRPINPYRDVDVVAALRLADLADAPVVPGYQEASLAALEQALSPIVAAGAVPLAIGGDHSVSLPALRALAGRHGRLALVHFDSHSDTWESYFGGTLYSAGTPFRRAAEEGLIEPAASLQLGLRGSHFTPRDVRQSEELGFAVLGTEALLAEPPAAIAACIARRVGGRPVYLTFDMDVVDPSAAPGVQTPEAGGPTAREILAILRALPYALDLVGGDVVETNPLYDGPGQITALLAATVAAELLALIAAGRRTRPRPRAGPNEAKKEGKGNA
jgi:agmatinase